MFMASLNNYNTRSQMALDIPFCRTNKGQKTMPFLCPNIWNKLNSNIKTAATTASLTHHLKKETLDKLARVSNFTELFLTVDCFSFTIFPCVHTSYREPNGNKNCFGSFLSHPCHLRSSGIFCFMLLL